MHGEQIMQAASFIQRNHIVNRAIHSLHMWVCSVLRPYGNSPPVRFFGDNTICKYTNQTLNSGRGSLLEFSPWIRRWALVLTHPSRWPSDMVFLGIHCVNSTQVVVWRESSNYTIIGLLYYRNCDTCRPLSTAWPHITRNIWAQKSRPTTINPPMF